MAYFTRLFLILSLAVIVCPTVGTCNVEIVEKYSDTYSPLAVYLVFGGDTVFVKLDVANLNLRGAGLVPSKLAVIPWQGGGYRMLPNTSEFNKDSTVFMQCLTGSPSDTAVRANTYKVNQKGDCQYVCQTRYFSALVNELENGNILVVDYGFDAGRYVVRTHVICKGVSSDSVYPVKRSYDYGGAMLYGVPEHNGEYDMFQFIAPNTILFVAGHNVKFMISGGGASCYVVADTTVLKFNISTVSVKKFEHQGLPLINHNRSLGQSFDILGRKINASLGSHFYPGVRIARLGNGFKTQVSVR